MGVIQRQGTKNSMVGILGLAVGAFATFFIYPNALEAYGVARFLIDSSLVLSPILLLGLHSLPLKFYSKFQDEKSGNHGFLSLLLLLSFIFACVIGFLMYSYQNVLTKKILLVDPQHPLINDNLHYLIPLGIVAAWSVLLTQYINVFKLIVVPAILNNLFVKIGTATIIYGVLIKFISVEYIGPGLLIIYLAIFVILLFYLAGIGQFQIKRIDYQYFRKRRKKIIDYALFSAIGGLGYLVAFRIDSIMVYSLVGDGDNGAYSIGLFIGTAISIPVAAITSISAPLVSEWWKNNDTDKIQDLYKKSSINLMVIGVGLFLLIISSLDDLILLLPKKKEFDSLYSVVFFLGLARLADMSLGIKNQIILYSDSYRFSLYTLLVLAGSNVVANLFFIKVLGLEIVGAAIATLISFTLFNIVYFIFILKKFKMQPFGWSTAIVLTVGGVLMLLGRLLPVPLPPFVSIVLRSAILGICYAVIIYKLKVSDELNKIVISLYERYITPRFNK